MAGAVFFAPGVFDFGVCVAEELAGGAAFCAFAFGALFFDFAGAPAMVASACFFALGAAGDLPALALGFDLAPGAAVFADFFFEDFALAPPLACATFPVCSAHFSL